MSTLGKVLLFINLLAAAGVAYLASDAWSQRQRINAVLLKSGLHEDGFPLELAPGQEVSMSSDDVKVPFDIRTTAGRTASSVRVNVLKEYFGGAKGQYTDATPPASVIDEATKIQANFKAKVGEFDNNPVAGLAFLIGSAGADGRLVPGPLMLLADDYEERMLFRSWLVKAAENPNAADKYFKYANAAVARKFNEAVAKADENAATQHVEAVLAARKVRDDAFDAYQKAPVDQQAVNGPLYQAWQAGEDSLADKITALKPATSNIERRRQAGVLMTCLDLSAAGQKRAALVLGVRSYIASVYDRVGRLQSMPERYERAVESELAQFVVQYERRLAAAKDLDLYATKQKSNRASLEASDAQLKELGNQRRTQRDAAATEADAVEKSVTAASASQAEIEQTLFQLQKQVGALLNENFDLEDKLIQAERLRSTAK